MIWDSESSGTMHGQQCHQAERLERPLPVWICEWVTEPNEPIAVYWVISTFKISKNNSCIITQPEHHRHHRIICDHGTAAKRRYCCCGKCSLIGMIENTCPQAYSCLTPCRQSTTLMSFYSSDFLLPLDNWWKVLNSVPFSLGGLLGLPLPSQSISTAVACDRKRCFRSRRAYTSTSLQDEVITFQDGKGTLILTCFELVKPSFADWMNDTTTDPKDLASLVLLLLIIAGDIELNPGPQSGTPRPPPPHNADS